MRAVDRDEHLPPKRYEPGLVLTVEGAFHQLDNEVRGYGTRDFPAYEHTVGAGADRDAGRGAARSPSSARARRQRSPRTGALGSSVTVPQVTGLILECTARTDVGRRSNNEDTVFASPRLAAVADGVGGAAAGEVASRTLINALVHVDKCRLEGRLEDALAAGIARGNEAIGFMASCRPGMAGMSTTVTAVALGDDGCVVANVGDSRTYLLRDGVLTQLTHDDSWVQLMIDSGELTPEAARDHPQRSLVLAALDGEPDRGPA